MDKKLEIVHTNKKSTCEAYLLLGYEPINCNFGQLGSVLGPLRMDQQGTESWRKGVARRAYERYFGSRKDDPRFVVIDEADASTTFCIAVLSGLLPHPSRANEFASAPDDVRTAMTRDITNLAELVDRADIAPIGLRLEETEDGAFILLWKQLRSGVQDALAYYAGVDRWRQLLGDRPPMTLLAAARYHEAARVKLAREAWVVPITEDVILVDSPYCHFDVWYADSGANVVVLLTPGQADNVFVACRDTATAERLFGAGGLSVVFPYLSPKGWSGRSDIATCPSGATLSRTEALAAANLIAHFVKRS
jgi:hypothetical protein